MAAVIWCVLENFLMHATFKEKIFGRMPHFWCLSSCVFGALFQRYKLFLFYGSMPMWIEMPPNRKRLYFDKKKIKNPQLNSEPKRCTTYAHQAYSFFYYNRPLLQISENFYDFSMRSTVVSLSSRCINCFGLTT